VGGSTAQAIVGGMLAPALLDRLLARKATEGQMTDEPERPGRADNLFAPVGGDFGAHGRFGRRSAQSAMVVNPASARLALAGLGLAALAAGIAYAVRARPVRRLPGMA
jgi:hypothetical protein